MTNNHEIKHPWVQLRFHTEVNESVGSPCALYYQKHWNWNYYSTVRGLWANLINWSQWTSGFGDTASGTKMPTLKLRTNTAQHPFSDSVSLLIIYQSQMDLFKALSLPLSTEIS